jgi:hypothetical protein
MYDVKTIPVTRIEGREPVPVRSVLMPRADFLALVEDEIDTGPYAGDARDGLRRELLPVAKSMPRFPLGTWLDEERGCGCVVGEYLVARQEIDDFNARVVVADAVGDNGQLTTVRNLLRENPLGDALFEFGNRIDGRMRNLLRDDGFDGDDSLRHPDDDYDAPVIRSVEIV